MSRLLCPSCRLLLALLVATLVGVSGLHAQTTGKIAGTITDVAAGEPLPGVNVVIEGTTIGGVSDARGNYFIINVPPGTYTVRASMVGFSIVNMQNVTVNVDQTTTVDFGMQVAVVAGEEIVVVAERPLVERDLTGSVQKMDAAALTRTPLRDMTDVLAQQTGVFETGYTSYIRGGVNSEITYSMDGTSLNSGLLSDNWQRLNTTAIQEVSILTGGYNAEYGNAMSGIVNVVTHEPSAFSRSLNGAVRYRVRPPGQYHWGPNMYDENLWKYTNFDLNHWQQRLQDEGQRNQFAAYYRRFYGWDGQRVPTAQELLDTYRDQITPDKVLADYTERMQHEIETSIWGSPANRFSFLLSGRYERGLNIFPQSNAYNPEYNLQGKFNYYFNTNQRLSLNLLRGWYNSSTYTESNWNNMESSQEARWQPNADVRGPYDNKAYAPWGGYWLKGPEEKAVNMATLQWQHTLGPRTFYNVSASYLSDYTTSLQEYDKLQTSTATLPWGDSWFDLGGNFRLEARQIQVNNYSDSKAFTLSSDITSQISNSHQLKAGLEFKRFDLDYQHYYMEFPAGDVWHLDNVFTGSPVEGSLFIQDKMEYQGIVLNIGIRADAFNAMHEYAPSIYDPLMFQTHNGGDGRPSNITPIWQAGQTGYDWFAGGTDFRDAFPDGWESSMDKQTVESEWKFAISPRLGLAFPITENSKLRFSYGHFNQRPSWIKLLGFPTSWYDSDPWGSVRMDQWQGWYGHPGLSYERTIQYEVGFTQNFFDFARLDIAAYYKDATGLTRFSHNSTYNQSGGGFAATGWGAGNFTTYAYTRNLANDGHDNIFYVNNGFKDIRGIEVVGEKLFAGRWSARATFDYSLSTGGVTGYRTYRENAAQAHTPQSFEEIKGTWLSSYLLKGNLNYLTPENLLAGVLGEINIALYHEYFAGPQYTYYPRDFDGLRRPNNKRWFPHQRTDLTFTKQFALAGMNPVVGIDVFNLFNYKDKVMLGGQRLEDWEERGEIPKYSKSGEEELWWFYNPVSNPRRMIYFKVGFQF